MHRWLADPEESHPVPDPDSKERFAVEMDWTPINAVSTGKAQLVLDEARRFVGS